MSLAAVLIVCGLVASPSIGVADSSAVPVIAKQNQREQDSPPTAPPPETPTPPEQGKPEPPSAPPQTPAPATQSENPQPDSTAKKPAAAATKKRHRKRKPTAQPESSPTKTVVSNGSTTDPKAEITPSVTDAQASHQRQNTTELLDSTDANLKKLAGHQLTPSQQDTMKQIQSYVEQAKVADAAGDLQMAHNLAFKARLLSDELVKP
jgi:outer membrane biosynthesis protein TonB